MSTRTDRKAIILFVLSVGLIMTSFTAIFLTYYYSDAQFQVLGTVCEGMIEESPDKEKDIIEIFLRAQNTYTVASKEKNILASFGYGRFDLFCTNENRNFQTRSNAQ